MENERIGCREENERVTRRADAEEPREDESLLYYYTDMYYYTHIIPASTPKSIIFDDS